MDFNLGSFVFTIVTFLDSQENFAGKNLIVKCIELFYSLLNERDKTPIGIEMNGVYLNLHAKGFVLIIRTDIQRTIIVQLFKTCKRLVRINLCGTERGMAKKILDGS